jgi:predicted Zn finger-like uncharacterized protein
MLIVCPNCATSYQVEPSSLGPAGRSVRCARCQGTWFAANTEAMGAIAQAHRSDIAEFASPPAADDPAALPPAAPIGQDLAAEPSAPAEAQAPSASAEAPQAAPAEPVDSDPQNDAPPLAASPGDQPSEPASPPEPQATADAPSLAPAEHGEAPAPPEDIESVAARHRRPGAMRRRTRSPMLSLPMVILALIAANVGLIGWRVEVVRWLPQTASLYAAIGLPVNLRGLTFSDIETRREVQEGVPVLIVEGFISNETRRVAQVPRLRLSVRNVDGHEIYAWTSLPARSAIPAGAMLPFRSRLASPPPETHEVLVRFFNKRDLVAGIQ